MIEKYGRLTVLQVVENNKALVLCDCGKQKTVRIDYMKKGKTKSCGCMRAEMLSERRKTHGKTDTREYRCWCKMKSRCSNPNDISYPNYGAKGIEVCEEWIHSFEKFLNDMGVSPKNGTIDRIDPSKGYSKENCRWLSIQDQQNNRSNNHFIEYNGQTKTISQWARVLGVKYATLYQRIIIKKIPIEDAMVFNK